MFIFSCGSDSEENNIYTGETITYSLFSGSEVGSAGQVEFRERTDGAVDVIVTLDFFTGGGKYPVHLHYGDLSNPDAPQATLLSDFDGNTGKSVTTISVLADETPFTFQNVKNFDGSIKMHLANTGADYDVIISAGNIGSNESKGFNLESIANCGQEVEL
jgi:hypothetical protein